MLQILQLVDSSYLRRVQQLLPDRMAYAELNVRFQQKPIGITGNSHSRDILDVKPPVDESKWSCQHPSREGPRYH